eukprot:scpid35911/ scgid4928/ 
MSSFQAIVPVTLIEDVEEVHDNSDKVRKKYSGSHGDIAIPLRHRQLCSGVAGQRLRDELSYRTLRLQLYSEDLEPLPQLPQLAPWQSEVCLSSSCAADESRFSPAIICTRAPSDPPQTDSAIRVSSAVRRLSVEADASVDGTLHSGVSW